MTYIKICGITHREDALAAIGAGADAIGFIAVPESPRYVAAIDFRRIREVLPPDFPVVLVVKRLRDAEKYHAPIVQYYEAPEGHEQLDEGTKRVQVYRVHGAEDIEAAKHPPAEVSAVLLDAAHIAVLGGSGTRFEWDLTKPLREGADKPFILAGGLNVRNIMDALDQVRPYGVDVSSGVEDEIPGKKNLELVERFIHTIRAWDRLEGIERSKKPFLA